MKKSFVLLILLFVLASCTASQKDLPAIQHLSLFDTKWNLVEINQSPIATPNESKRPHIQFSKKEMKATGNNGCNSVFATIDTIEDRLSFGPVGSTRMACQDGMEIEMAFLGMLQASKKYRIDGYTLLIIDGKGQVVGNFVAAN